MFCAAALPAGFAQQAPQAPPAPPAQTPMPPRVRVAGAASQMTPYIGVNIMVVDAALAKTLKLKEERGVQVTQLVAGGPAEKAGVKVGDVILEFDGQHVQGEELLQRLVREMPAGRVAKLGIWRNGAMQTIDVKIELRREMEVGVVIPRGTWGVDGPDYWPTVQQFPMDMPRMQTIMQNQVLGVECEALGDEQQFAEFFGVKDGLLVKAVAAGSPATRGGIKAGDVITKVDETHVSTMRELTAALRAAAQKGNYQVTVVRNKKEMQISVSGGPWHGMIDSIWAANWA
jgi:serine protease Do